jgi:N-hydroxyarylamine O-acetyltransferase
MSNEFRLEKYLARIGYKGALEANLHTLAALAASHVDAIPFEGFDPLLRRPGSLDLSALQAKLVDGRRGGYCFEQNTLFKAALETVGFAVTGLAGRVRWMSPPDSPLGPKTHMMLKVDLAEGTYLADVGFGACLLDAPLQLKTDIDQRTAMGTYRLSRSDGLFFLGAKQPAGWRTMYAFDLQPQIPADYVLANWFTSTSPLVPFTSRLVMERLSSDKRYKLNNRTFLIEARDGEVTATRELAGADELREVIDDTFRITLPAPAEEIFKGITSAKPST